MTLIDGEDLNNLTSQKSNKNSDMPLNIVTNKITSPKYKNAKSEFPKDYMEPNSVDIQPMIQTKLGQFRENY
jgi:hypothetical protein